MKRTLTACGLLLALVVPIYLNLRAGEKAGRFWDGEEKVYVLAGTPEYQAAVFNRRVMLVFFPTVFVAALLRSRRAS